jgi:DNA repair protein RecN (Recombination protein N)
MLNTLIIRNLALIEHQTIEFDKNLNIVTGETGAGKSILIGAMQLLLGERADKSLIRTGEKTCELDVILELGSRPDLLQAVNALLEEAGVPICEEGQLIGSRKITESSSRNFVNTAPVTLQLLKKMGTMLVDVHGPYDNQSLLKPARQLAVLDEYANNGKNLERSRELYRQWRDLNDQLQNKDGESPSPELIDFLKFQLNEIEKAGLTVGEDLQLGKRHEIAAHAQTVLSILSQSRDQLTDSEECIVDQAMAVRRDLQELERVDEETGKRFGAALESCISQLQDLSGDIADYAEGVEVDPEEFVALEERLGLINRLKRKYGGSIEGALAHAEECRGRLQKLEHFDEFRVELERRIQAAEKTLRNVAGTLRKARKKAAAKLGPKITAKLKKLGFPDCDFRIDILDADLSPTGADAVEFFFAPNPGEGNRALREIASSGEISRVMLALKVELAEADRIPLLIFDEVDANVGG